MDTNDAEPPSATVLKIMIENDTLVAENSDGRRRLSGFIALREANSWRYAKRLGEFMALCEVALWRFARLVHGATLFS